MKPIETQHIKKPKTFKEQVEILKSRGIIVTNNDLALNILKGINYYRLSAYILTHKKSDGNYHSISIEDIYKLYVFDKNLET